MRQLRWVAGSLALLAFSAAAQADDPKFVYGKYEEKKDVEWKASASAGLLLTTGNANQVSFSAAAMASRHDGKNKLQLDVNGAYARATVISANDGGDGTKANGTIDNSNEISRESKTSTALWNVKLRYDRFFSANNAGYITGFAWGNEPAGKTVVAGAQVGYSRQAFKNDMHLLVAELGYDFSYERLGNTPATVSPNYYLHSLRLYLGYTLSLSKDTSFLVDVEYLGNMNPFDGPYSSRVGAFEDSRVTGRASLTTRIWKKLAFRIQFTAKFDNVPAPLPSLSVPFAAGFVPAAEKLDTITDASLVVNFL